MDNYIFSGIKFWCNVYSWKENGDKLHFTHWILFHCWNSNLNCQHIISFQFSCVALLNYYRFSMNWFIYCYQSFCFLPVPRESWSLFPFFYLLRLLLFLFFFLQFFLLLFRDGEKEREIKKKEEWSRGITRPLLRWPTRFFFLLLLPFLFLLLFNFSFWISTNSRSHQSTNNNKTSKNFM